MLTSARFLLFICLLLTIGVSQAQVKKPVAKKTTLVKAKYPKKPIVKSALKPVKAIGTRVKITTDVGDILVRLYDKTPQHRDNFIKLVNNHFYDSLLFHRVIAGFMIQGGDPESRNAQPGIMLGKGDAGYTIPAELDSTLYHKKGVLAAARNDNPEKASSGCQFYIVQGKKYTDDELNMIEMQRGIHLSSAKRMTYKMLGGTPTLDMNYTVFGEVESGIETVDKIAQAEKDNFNRPLKDIHMKMEVVK
ncbi:MAG: peptidylprolyl isomerase [Ferruginibacter sp.]